MAAQQHVSAEHALNSLEAHAAREYARALGEASGLSNDNYAVNREHGDLKGLLEENWKRWGCEKGTRYVQSAEVSGAPGEPHFLDLHQKILQIAEGVSGVELTAGEQALYDSKMKLLTAYMENLANNTVFSVNELIPPAGGDAPPRCFVSTLTGVRAGDHFAVFLSCWISVPADHPAAQPALPSPPAVEVV